jgi:hypothetical protein
VALVAVALLAGWYVGSSSPEGATAKELQPAAAERASAWSGEASLVLAGAVEPAREAALAEGEPASRVDPSPGDGRSGAWAFRYEAADREERLEVVVDANGTVRGAGPRSADGGACLFGLDPSPVGRWSVDSDAAADAAFDEPPGARSGLEATYALLVGQSDVDPIWVVGAEYEDGTERARYVNASDGTVFESAPAGADGLWGDRSEDAPPHEGGRENGTVAATEPTAEHTFQVEAAGHPCLSVGLVTPYGNGGTLNVTVEGPEGTTEAFEVQSQGSLGRTVSIPGPAAGPWRATVTLEEGTAERYRLDWCASDRPVSGLGGAAPTADRGPCWGAS